MLRFKPIFIACAALFALALAAGPSRADTVVFKASLTPAAEVPPTNSTGKGDATVTLDTATKQLTWKITYSGFTSDPTAAHIHGPAAAGANAGVLINLAPNGVPKTHDGTLTGSATATDAQIADLQGGKCYVNIHTVNHKSGAIRGQLAK